MVAKWNNQEQEESAQSSGSQGTNDTVKNTWLNEHVFSKFNFENTLLFISIVIAIIFAIISFILYRTPHREEFWTNYWTGAPIFITIIAALSSFYIQTKIDQKNNAFDNYFQYQDEIDKEIMPKFTQFQISKIDKSYDKDKNELVQDLSAILLTLKIVDNKRGHLTPQINNNVYQEHRELTDYREYFGDKLREVCSNRNYHEVVEIVKNSHDYFEKTLKELLSNNEDLKKLSKEERENLNKKINNYDNLILKAWILKKTSAEEAHFLLGVATSDKRVVGVYDISRESIHINPDNNRIEFQINNVNNRKYLEGITSAYSEKKSSLPGIEDWKATNPVLYYISYLKARGQYANFDEKDKKDVLHLIGKDSGNVDSEWAKLSDRDIIVVRTSRFD